MGKAMGNLNSIKHGAMDWSVRLFCLVPLGSVQQHGFAGFFVGPATILLPLEFLQVARHRVCGRAIGCSDFFLRPSFTYSRRNWCRRSWLDPPNSCCGWQLSDCLGGGGVVARRLTSFPGSIRSLTIANNVGVNNSGNFLKYVTAKFSH